MKIKPITVTEKQISPEGSFITSKDLFDRACVTPRSKANWINSHQLFINDGRVYTPIMANYRLWWMSAITGTLYDNKGQCRSGNKPIDLSKMFKNDDEAKRILMSKPVI